MQKFNRTGLKKFLFYLLIVLFAYSVGGAIVNILEEKTLGSIFRHLLPTTIFLFLILLINIFDTSDFSFSSLIPRIPSNISLNKTLKWFIPLLIFGFLMGLITIFFFIEGGGGVVATSVTLYLLISLVVSCFYMLKEKRIYGIILFFVAMPFLIFLQKKSYEIGLDELRIFELAIPFSAIYLLITFFFFGAGHNRGILNEVSDDKKTIMACFLFVLTPIFSIIFSIYSLHSLVYYLLDILLPFLFFIILMKSIKEVEDVNKIIFSLVASIFVYQIIGLYSVYQIGSIEHATTKVYSFEGVTSHSFVLYPLIIPLLIAMYNIIGGWKRWAVVFMLIISLIYLFISNYRTSIVSSFAGFAIFFIFFYRSPLVKKIIITSTILILLLGFFLAGNTIFDKLGYFRVVETIQKISERDSLESLTSGRTYNWATALKIISGHPFFGIGPDMWAEYVWQYSTPRFWYKDYNEIWRQAYAYDPHNLYLLIWLNYGIASLIFYLYILYIALKRGIYNIQRSSSSAMRNIAVASLISLINWLIISIFTLRFFDHRDMINSIFLWSILAVTFKTHEFNQKLINQR